ncbi:MAG TPA: biotin transporter BioY [Chroococcidiopsis sp.]
MSTPTELLWALIGLILTIGGTFLEASITNAPWNWVYQGLQPLSLGVSYQVGAVLLVACLGGKNAAVISQIAYLLLGLTWFNVFTQGGGIDYIYRPSFGYLLGFIPGAWICGHLAFRLPTRLESLAASCLCGLAAVHVTGLAYVILATRLFGWVDEAKTTMLDLFISYSVTPIPGQLVVVCAVTVLSYILRNLMFY